MSDLLSLLRKNPKLIKVLNKHGINFCAGCYLTLSATPERAAAYHGVSDIDRFLQDVDRAVSKRPRHHHSTRGR